MFQPTRACTPPSKTTLIANLPFSNMTMAHVRDKLSRIISREPVLFSLKFLITFPRMRRSRISSIEVFLISEMFPTIPEFVKAQKLIMLNEGQLNLVMCLISTRVEVRSKLLTEHLLKLIR